MGNEYVSLERLAAARDKAAVMVMDDPQVAATFEAVDNQARSMEERDPVARARAIAAGRKH